jgi:hypothetical protein
VIAPTFSLWHSFNHVDITSSKFRCQYGKIPVSTLIDFDFDFDFDLIYFLRTVSGNADFGTSNSHVMQFRHANFAGDTNLALPDILPCLW